MPNFVETVETLKIRNKFRSAPPEMAPGVQDVCLYIILLAITLVDGATTQKPLVTNFANHHKLTNTSYSNKILQVKINSVSWDHNSSSKNPRSSPGLSNNNPKKYPQQPG